ncbi:hypothetical protein [Edaphobacter aggregans]|uniref:hypothetical protein n=1 Tax=Edaphobacter aggregans TaxID=570835 RepID=UPI0012FB2920|nr:hypothetical protein [Edaphobacter aggregans]
MAFQSSFFPVVLLAISSSLASAQYGCPPYPFQRQCDPGDGTVCSKNVIPPGPKIYPQGPYEVIGYDLCCTVPIPVVINYYPIGCWTAELKTKESQQTVFALIRRGEDIFAMDCSEELRRFTVIRVPFKQNTDLLEPSIRVEKIGGI